MRFIFIQLNTCTERGNQLCRDVGYQPLRILGRGAYGIVFKCRQRWDHRDVVVKFAINHSSSDDKNVDDEGYIVVPKEVGILARLKHDNIVKVSVTPR